MAIGAFKFLSGLNPIVLYSFDRSNTFQLDETVYYTNSSNYSAPILMVEDTHLFRSNENPITITPAISNTENVNRYKSFSSGNLGSLVTRPYFLQIVQGSNPVRYRKVYNQVVYVNESSRCSIADLPQETLDIINTNDVYTVIFHIDFRLMYPEKTSTFAQRVRYRHGSMSYEEFVDGVESDQYYLQPNTADEFNSKTICFRILDLLLHITPLNASQAQLHYSNLDGSVKHLNMIDIDMYKPNIIKIEFNRVTGNMKINVGGKPNTIILPYTNLVDKKMMQFGFKTSMELQTPPPFVVGQLYVDPETPIQTESDFLETVIGNDDVVSYNGMTSDANLILDRYVNTGTFYKLYVTDCEVMLDNVCIFDRVITTNEFNKYYSLHNDLITHYKEKGFIELYDFKNYYDRVSTRYLMNNEILSTKLINVANDTLYVRTEGNYNDIYGERHYDGKIEYSLNISKRSMIYDRYAMFHPRFIRGRTFSLSFFFKTLSENGTLFSFFYRVPVATNLYIKFFNGALQVMVGETIVNSISGYNDGVFHQISVYNTNGSCAIMINDIVLYETNNGEVYNGLADCVFGNMHPTMDGLNFNLAMLAYATKNVNQVDVYNLYNNIVIYEASGIVTLNNIRVGSTILIYNEHSGEMIDKIRSDSITGEFKYYNRYPYTIMVIVVGDTEARNYIVSPIEIT